MVDMTSPTVKAIDSRSVHQICSGQVVVTLSTAMKELVENSLDAGATNIEIRLKNYGADCIEVIDNGSGVVPENFEALALKHHTSKLNVFSDLVGVETFGFRGEALSSLCALSNLSVTTCHQSQSVGARIDYDHDGKITKQTPTARVQGTTVTIQDLFYTLPVRHKEFLRNIKREYAKLIQVLQSYCIISTGVRINCFTQSEKGKKTLVLSTNDNAEMRENISNIFGPKQLKTLSEFKQISPRPADCEEHGLDMDNVNENPVFKLTGYVSCCEHGSGRSTTERQFIFINKRPCDLPKVVRVVNEVYHGYNRNQYPFLALNISLDKELVDVNVTPDKRHIFMQQEKLLLATIKSSLKAMFDPGSTSYSLNDKPFAQIKLGISKSTDEIAKQSEFSQSIKDRLMQANSMKLANLKKKGYNSIMKFAKRVMIRQAEKTEHVANGDDTSAPVVQEDENSEAGISQDSSINEVELADCCEAEMKHDDILEVPNCDGSENSSCQSVSGRHSESSLNLVENDMEKSFETVERCTSDYEANVCMSSDADEVGNGRGRASGTLKRKFQILHEELPLQQDGDNNSCKKIRIDKECDNGNGARDNRKSITVQFDWDKLGKHGKASKETYTSAARIFRAPITPEDNQNAEDELQRHITKDKFNQMEIIGQFNQGFIISKLRNDLFIIDQHASDEKYNFEEQQKNTVLKSQRLIRPQALDLTAVNEGILVDNIKVFHKNGFDFEIDEEAPVSKKVKLVSVPVSRNWSFGKSDIDELIFMLSDNPGMMYRPSSVRKMFAMRACRMSIMVGRALDRSQMKRILGHMGEMDHPWNCPHGRPTMRHLINLNMVRK